MHIFVFIKIYILFLNFFKDVMFFFTFNFLFFSSKKKKSYLIFYDNFMIIISLSLFNEIYLYFDFIHFYFVCDILILNYLT